MEAKAHVQRKIAEFLFSSQPCVVQFTLAMRALYQYKPYALFMHTENSALITPLEKTAGDREASS